MKKILRNLFVTIAVLIVLLFSYHTKAKTIQNQLTIIDKLEFDFLQGSTQNFFWDILPYYSDGVLYLIPKNQDVTVDTIFFIFSYCPKNKKVDTITVKFPAEHLFFNMFIPEKIRQEYEILEKYESVEDDFSINNFAISAQYLVVGGEDRILIFARNDNDFDFLYAIKPKEIYGFEDIFFNPRLKIINDTLLGYRSHTYDAGSWTGFSSFADNADSNLVSTVIMKYHLKNRELIDFRIIYPGPKGFGFLNFFPRHNMDCNGIYFIISDVSVYNLYLYDTDWNLVDKISPNHNNWIKDKNLPDALTVTVAYKEHPRASIAIMDPFTHTTSLIHNVMFKNPETILVSWTVPTGSKNKQDWSRYKFFFDDFKIVDGKLKLVNTFEQAEIDKNSEKLFGTAGANALTMPNDYYLFNGYLISISEEVPFDIFSDEIQNMSLRDYYQKLDDYYISNPIKRAILIYKFK